MLIDKNSRKKRENCQKCFIFIYEFMNVLNRIWNDS